MHNSKIYTYRVVSIYIYVFTSLHADVNFQMPINLCTFYFTYVVCTCAYELACVHIYSHVYTGTYTFTSLHVYLHIVYVYITCFYLELYDRKYLHMLIYLHTHVCHYLYIGTSTCIACMNMHVDWSVESQFLHLWTHLHLQMHLRCMINIHTHKSICIRTRVCVQRCISIWSYIDICRSVSLFVYLCVCICMCTYFSMHRHLYMCLCLCVFYMVLSLHICRSSISLSICICTSA